MKTPNDTFNLQEKLIEDSIFIIGNVFKVEGQKITVKVNQDKNLPHLFFNGKTVRNASVGLSNYVKILKGFTEIICKIEGESLTESKKHTDKEYSSEKQKMERFLNVSVFGFYDDKKKFQHGIKEMPLIGSECRLLSKDEFEGLHELSDKEKLSIDIGSLTDEETQRINIYVQGLFAGHIGIFGNTGSGKSNTIAKIYTELFSLENLNDDFKEKSTFIFIDFNGEYSSTENDKKSVLTENKKIYQLNTRNNEGDKYPIGRKEIEKLEVLSILLDATEKTQRPFLHRAIDKDWFDKDNQNFEKEINNIEKKLKDILTKKDKNFNVPFLKKYVEDFKNLGFEIRDSDVFNDLKYYNMGNSFFVGKTFSDGDSQKLMDEYFSISRKTEKFSYSQKIQFKILDQYYFEILNGYSNEEHISPLIGRLKKQFDMLEKVFEIEEETSDEQNSDGKKNEDSCDKDSKKNIHVINLKNVNLEMKKIIPLLICKNHYDKQKNERDSSENNSLHLIIDEAHNILSESSNRESETWKDYRLETFEEIIKEGRKFGVFLTIASQRPSDISPTIISQLHNYFIHKLMNNNDLHAINKAVAYLDKPSFDSISNLSIGCCFIAGQMTRFPLSVRVELLDKNKQPKSETTDLDKLWRKRDTDSEK